MIGENKLVLCQSQIIELLTIGLREKLVDVDWEITNLYQDKEGMAPVFVIILSATPDNKVKTGQV